MKKKVVALFLGAVMTVSSASYVFADSGVTVKVNDAVVELQAEPVIIDGRTFISNTDFENIVKVLGGNNSIKEVSEETLVPVRELAESLGATVDWDSENKTVEITKQEEQKNQEKIDENDELSQAVFEYFGNLKAMLDNADKLPKEMNKEVQKTILLNMKEVIKSARSQDYAAFAGEFKELNVQIKKILDEQGIETEVVNEDNFLDVLSEIQQKATGLLNDAIKMGDTENISEATLNYTSAVMSIAKNADKLTVESAKEFSDMSLDYAEDIIDLALENLDTSDDELKAKIDEKTNEYYDKLVKFAEANNIEIESVDLDKLTDMFKL